MTPLPAVGARFRLVRDVERYPHFIAAEDELGTVTDLSDGHVWLRLDAPLPGAEAWDNEILWETADDFWAHVEPAREGEIHVANGRADTDAVGVEDLDMGSQRGQTADPDFVTWAGSADAARWTPQLAEERDEMIDRIDAALAENRASREWRELDTAARTSAFAAPELPAALYEQRGGTVDFDEWAAGFVSDAELARAGIERPELPARYPEVGPEVLPDRYAYALGDDRSGRLLGLVEDSVRSFTDAPPGHQELSAREGELEAAGEGLDIALGRRVWELEWRRDGLSSSLSDSAERQANLVASVGALDRWLADQPQP